MVEEQLSLADLHTEMALTTGERHFTLERPLFTSAGSHIWLASEISKKERRRGKACLLVLSPLLFEHNRHTAAIEAQIALQEDWHHANVVQIQAVARDPAGWHFAILEATEGASLKSMISKHHFKPELAKAVMKSTASILHSLHSKRILHLDLSPHSILITRDYQLKLLNTSYQYSIFQTLHEGQASAPAHPDNDSWPSLRYLAPELLQTPASPSPAADIFSLGCLCYELLMGEPLFKSTERFPLPDIPSLHTNQWKALNRLLALAPEERPTRQLNELIDDIFTPREDPPAHPLTTERPIAKAKRFDRRRILMLAGATLSGLAIINFLIYLVLHKSPHQQEMADLTEQIEQLLQNPQSEADLRKAQQLFDQFYQKASGQSGSRKLEDNITAFFMKLHNPALQAPADISPGKLPAPKAASPNRLRAGDSFTDALANGMRGPLLMVIPSGSAYIGNQDRRGSSDELAPHFVSYSAPFALMQDEVTFEDYDLFAKATGRLLPDDNGWGRGRRPVINVSWYDANAYAIWLSNISRHVYRLPTEEEWEYSARANTSTAYWWGGAIDKGHGNCQSCGSEWDNLRTAPVGAFPANNYGLFDVSGNVSEWVGDCYTEGSVAASGSTDAQNQQCMSRVIKGGSWRSPPALLRSSARQQAEPDNRNSETGFRLLREISDQEQYAAP